MMVDKPDASKAEAAKPVADTSQEQKPEGAVATIGTVAPCGTIASVGTIGTLAAAQSTQLGGPAASQSAAFSIGSACIATVATAATFGGPQATIHASIATIHATIHATIQATIHATHGTLAECAGTAPCAGTAAAGSTQLGGVRAAAAPFTFGTVCGTAGTIIG